jgi:phospho-2-dehydro-3-deoxyheptonate aldolase
MLPRRVSMPERLAPIRERLKDRLEVVMRVYFEKPRTTCWLERAD